MISRRCRNRTLLLVWLLALAAAPLLRAQQDRWEQLTAQALQLEQQGRFSEAMPIAQEALKVAEANYGPEEPHVARSLSVLAKLYKDQGKYGEAEPLLERALHIYEKTLGPEHLSVAALLNNLAVLYEEEGKYAEAEALHQRAIGIAEKALGPEHPDVATALNTLAALYEKEGKSAQAEPLLQRVLKIRQEKLGPNDPGVALALNNLAEHYQNQGRYAEAEPLYPSALRILEKGLGPEHPYVARLLSNWGVLYAREGRYAEADPLYQRALRICEKAFGPEHPDVAYALNNLAELYRTEGKYAEAEPLYQRALRIWEKALGPEHPNLAYPLSNLGLLYSEQGKYVEAEPLYQRALRIREKALGAEQVDTAMSLNNLGMLYYEQGEYAQAEPLYQRALGIWEKALGAEHPEVANALNNLAALYEDQDRHAEAEPLYQRALRIREKALGPEHPDVALSLNNLAVLYTHQGKYSAAEPLYQQALRIREKALGPEHPQVELSLNNLAGLRFAQDQPREAEVFFARSFDILLREFQYHFTYMSEKERLGFLATVDYRFPLYFSFAHQFREGDPELTGRMYDLLLWQKGFIAGSVATVRRRVEASGDPEALKLLDRLAAKRAQIAALLNAQPPDREAWRKQVEQLESEANELERTLAVRSTAFAQQKKLERATWQQVRDALQPGEAAVEFARFRLHDGKKWTDTSYYVALVVTPETKDHPQYVVLGEARQLEGKPLVEYQQQVQARGTEAAAGSAPTGQPAEQTYELFWKPLERLLAGRTRVYLSADGVLNQLPLGLISAPDGKLLMEKYDLRLVSSTKDLLREVAPPTGNTAVLIGNPAFDLDESRQRATLGRLSTPGAAEPPAVAALAPSDRSRDQNKGGDLPELPGTSAEVLAVSTLLEQHQWQVTSYTGDRAMEEAVKQARRPRVLHIATHGFFLADQQMKPSGGPDQDHPSGLEDPMLRAGLFFAGADRALAGQATPDDLDDGVLTAYEAAGLNLQGTELVVLSACNTGQGEVKNGEGVFGLRRALEEAGAQAVMMSLWPVPDKETQELMTLFYSKWLGGKEKHEALRQAQAEMRERVRRRYGRDLPYYWGAFVLVGR